ncbi:MAG: prepilin-type N-terminal cleavage/methylation domain-containing protein [Gemmatimonadota bacterium]
MVANERGFSLAELIVALVISSIIGAALVGLFVSQTDFYRTEDALRDARFTARASMNVFLTDLRMVEVGGGVVAAAARDIQLRVPYAMGLVCSSTAATTDVSLFPTDSLSFANAGFSGWAWRNDNPATWNYVEVNTTRTDPGAASCAAAGITTLPDGRRVRLQPGILGLPAGTPVMFFQRIRYAFEESSTLPGRDGLFREVVAQNLTEELAAPFRDTARFRFYVGAAQAQDAVPADLGTIRGLELLLHGESVNTTSGSDDPLSFELNTSVFFQNRSDAN